MGSYKSQIQLKLGCLGFEAKGEDSLKLNWWGHALKATAYWEDFTSNVSSVILLPLPW